MMSHRAAVSHIEHFLEGKGDEKPGVGVNEDWRCTGDCKNTLLFLVISESPESPLFILLWFLNITFLLFEYFEQVYECCQLHRRDSHKPFYFYEINLLMINQSWRIFTSLFTIQSGNLLIKTELNNV